jgi:DNA-binding response OmpR family regulator
MRDKSLKELKILLVEDEENLARLLKEAIGDNFYSFSIAKNGVEGLEIYEKVKPDIIITDIMMPKMSGLEMAKELRYSNSTIPIIMISAFSEKEKLLGAIDVGVTKYFIKPFDPDELLRYIKSIASKFSTKIVELCDDFSFNKTTNSLYRNERFVSLSKNEIKFISLLLQSRSKIVDDVTIKMTLWKEETSDERLRTFIKRLRLKTSKNLIVNIKGEGYMIALSES